MKFINLSGLPRSGSTLLGNVLNQHPDITACMDSDLANIIFNISEHADSISKETQFTINQNEILYTDFMRVGIQSWVNNLCNTKFYLDKDRSWALDYTLLFKLIPDAKVIFLIRDLRGVISSFEKVQSGKRIIPPDVDLRPKERNEYHNVDLMIERVDNFLDGDMIYNPLFSLKELLDCERKYSRNFKFVRYEDFMENPKEFISSIYDFIGARPFDNDLNNIKQVKYHDACFTPYGIHTIKPKLVPNKVDCEFPLLKDEAQERIIDTCSWYYEEFYPEIFEEFKR